jgi:hypothetical protein
LNQPGALFAEGKLIVASPGQIFGQDHFNLGGGFFVSFPLRLIKRQSGEKTTTRKTSFAIVSPASMLSRGQTSA